MSRLCVTCGLPCLFLDVDYECVHLYECYACASSKLPRYMLLGESNNFSDSSISPSSKAISIVSSVFAANKKIKSTSSVVPISSSIIGAHKKSKVIEILLQVNCVDLAFVYARLLTSLSLVVRSDVTSDPSICPSSKAISIVSSVVAANKKRKSLSSLVPISSSIIGAHKKRKLMEIPLQVNCVDLAFVYARLLTSLSLVVLSDVTNDDKNTHDLYPLRKNCVGINCVSTRLLGDLCDVVPLAVGNNNSSNQSYMYRRSLSCVSCVLPDLVTDAVCTNYRAAAYKRYKCKKNKKTSHYIPRKKHPKINGRQLLTCVADQEILLPLCVPCRHCGAIKFYRESPNMCCADGDITLAASSLPLSLINILIDPTDLGQKFRLSIRTYNNHLAFTSLGVRADKNLEKRTNGIYTFKVQGQVYHFVNSLVSEDGSLKNAQLYFYDTNYESEIRLQACDRLAEPILKLLLDISHENPYAKFFRSLRHMPTLDNHYIFLQSNPRVDQKTLNRPTVDQVSLILESGSAGASVSRRDIRVYSDFEMSYPINYYYGCYDVLQYPLMFPYGEVGWHQGIQRNGIKQKVPARKSAAGPTLLLDPGTVPTAAELLENEFAVLNIDKDDKRYVAIREYYAYKFQMRPLENSYLLSFGRLFQQFVVDMYVKLESQRLDYYATQQKEIRQEYLQGVVDAVAFGETECSQIGRRTVLPANFTGGPRHMRRKYMDAMALVKKFGKPDFFLTMTCNPNWPEIKSFVLKTDETQNRSDLLVRVFKSKLEVMKNEIFNEHCFGEIEAYTYVIEYQKRGLPHAHFLLILKKQYKLYRPEEYDRFVSAELPHKQKNPYFHSLVIKHMLHGPCGSHNPNNVCMKNGTCKNFYPKSFAAITKQSADAYPIYKRRDNGERALVRGAWLDNRWVVPYPPYLVGLLDCHINMEICSNIKAIKYIYKYICKGNDKILFRLSDANNADPVNEIVAFQSARWVSAPEAMWRILRFSLGELRPPVIRLPLHLENYQPLTFHKKQRLRNVLNNFAQRKTMLTEFFVMNKTSIHAQNLQCTYTEFPDHFVWLSDQRDWKPREKGACVGRIVTAHPTDGERYFLRILLSKVRCPISFDDLKTYNGVLLTTFRESALARGYLENDDNQHSCLSEASLYHMPYELRKLFATILVHACPSDPKKLWLMFENELSEDFLKSKSLSPIQIKQKVLQQISDFLQSMGKDIATFNLLPLNMILADPNSLTKEINAERSIEISAADLNAKQLLNMEQSVIFKQIIGLIDRNEAGAFFIDGPGGTGKTFLYRALLAEVRSKGFVALASASSGIAASMLPGGRTAHSRFKIPLDLSEGASCSVSKQSGLALLIIESKLIIWDEAPMCQKNAIEALDLLLRDLMSKDVLFGGKVVVLGGDFRQTLPIILNGSKTDMLNVCLRASFLWPSLIKFTLSENMRARTDPEFTSFLLNIGNGTGNTADSELISIPMPIMLNCLPETDSLTTLITKIYPNFSDFASGTYQNRAILTTTNTFVDEINEIMINEFPGCQTEYLSYDQVLHTNDGGQFEEIINTLTPNGLPKHCLILKINAPIILLRNINPIEGLCNGTRLRCLAFGLNVIHAEISFGDFKGKHVFLHRIPMQPPTENQYPVPYKRTQFPVRLCFAMTINKSQGQTLDMVGVYLKEPVFSHGQLYVALSRAKTASCIYVFIQPAFCDLTTSNKTLNIVYKEALTDNLF